MQSIKSITGLAMAASIKVAELSESSVRARSIVRLSPILSTIVNVAINMSPNAEPLPFVVPKILWLLVGVGVLLAIWATLQRLHKGDIQEAIGFGIAFCALMYILADGYFQGPFSRALGAKMIESLNTQ